MIDSTNVIDLVLADNTIILEDFGSGDGSRDFRSPEPTPRYRCLKDSRVKQHSYSLFMCVPWTLRSWKISHAYLGSVGQNNDGSPQ